MPHKILIVDNNPVIIELLTHFFSEQGYEVRSAEDGLSALHVLESFVPDIMFVDLVMPNISGDKLCRIVRSTPALSDVYLIVLSAIVADEELDFREFGANACIAKGPLARMRDHIAVMLAEIDQKKATQIDRIIGIEDLAEREITKELLKAKRGFTVILENMVEGVVQLTREREIIFVNRAAAMLLDQPEEKLLSSDFLDYFDEQSRPLVTVFFSDWRGEAQEFGENDPTHIGARRVTFHLLPVPEDDGATMLVILHDVTARKDNESELGRYREHLEAEVLRRTAELETANRDLQREIDKRKAIEAALRESEGKYRLLVENQNELVVKLDKQQRLLYVSPSYCRTFGKSEAELLHTGFLPLIAEQDRDRVVTSLDSLEKPPHVTYHEERALTVAGGRWFGWAARAILDDQGKVDTIVSVGRDITERKKYDEALQRVVRGLSEVTGEAFFFSLVQCISGILEVDCTLVATISGDGARAKTIAACKNGALIENFEYELAGTPCENVAGKKLTIYPKNVRQYFLKDSLVHRWKIEAFIGTPLLGADGNALGILVCLSTKPFDNLPFVESLFRIFAARAGAELERMTAEKQLQEAHAQLEQRVIERTEEIEKLYKQLLHAGKMSAVGKLAASIAHEFNNPICGIRNVLEGLLRRTGLDKENQRMVELAIRECERVAKLTSDLQSFNRPTSGKVSEVDVHAALDDILLLCTKDFKTRKIKLKKKYAPKLPAILAVQDQIKQVFLNLLTNAKEAIGDAGGTVTIDTEQGDDEIIVHIADDGSGIQAEDVEHIFEPFFSTKPEVKGTGLGLAVSYGIVRRHGGDIRVRSEPGRGARFTVTLPREGTVV